MPKTTKIVLRVSPPGESRLEAFVEQCIRDGVRLIAVMGDDCARIEDLIDDFIVGDGSDKTRFILTSSHPDESLEDVIAFAQALTDHDHEGDIEIVDL
jgi:hypothetical protein